MVLAADPKVYLARLDTNSAVVDNTQTPAPTARLADVVPVNGTTAYVDNSQFYLTMFFALALVLVFLYLWERQRHERG